MSTATRLPSETGGLQLLQLEVGPMQNFCTLIVDPLAGQAAVVDPAYEVDRILSEAAARRLSITTVLVTHTHHDHVNGIEALARAAVATGVAGDLVVRVGAGEADEVARIAPSARIQPVADGERIPVGSGHVRALSTPGHTRAGTSYLVEGETGTGDGHPIAVLTGDTLFIGGCGRTDFPGGDAPTLYRSLQRILALPDATRIYPGHDYGPTPTATVGQQRQDNAYLRCLDEATFVALRTGPNPPRPTRGPR